jgi:hypothetical protein
MNRREFSKNALLLGLAAQGGTVFAESAESKKSIESKEKDPAGVFYKEPAKKIPVRCFDVVVVGAGTAGVVAALAAARNGAKTVLIERKGYPGGTVVEGGTALHSFFNLWKAFPGVNTRQVVKGIPQEIIDRLMKVGGCTGHAEMARSYEYDSVCTAIDTELYKLVTFEMLAEAGVTVWVNTLLAGAIMDNGRDGQRLRGVIAESRSGREAVYAKCFVDCSGFGDLSAFAGARFTEPNDYPVVNSMGVGGVSVEKLYEFFKKHDALADYCEGLRDGVAGRIIRIGGGGGTLPREMTQEADNLGMSLVTTTVHDDYFMFIKFNLKMPVSPTDRDAVAVAEVELRKRQARGVALFRNFVPGCEKAFISRTSPTLNIRRARMIECDYDIKSSDVLDAVHFDDDVFAYGFHDFAPRLKVKNGGTYGIPYKALRVAGIENLLAAGMLITSNQDAHMSTRNTVSCMGQGQATGTAAALCAAKKCGTRDLKYPDLRQALVRGGVYFEG